MLLCDFLSGGQGRRARERLGKRLRKSVGEECGGSGKCLSKL